MVEVLNYRESGMDNVVLVNGFRFEPALDGDTLLTIDAINRLHHRLMELIIVQTPFLTGSGIRWLRTEMDMDRKQLSAVLGIDETVITECELRDVPASVTLEIALRSLACDVLALPSYRETWVLDCDRRLPYRFELQFEQDDWVGRIAFNAA